MSMANIFAESQTLPHIPRVVQELIESFQDEDVNVDNISNKVALDQALTAKVLRLANSAHYGVSRTVSNPHDAIMLLGFNTLRTMVLASGVTSAFKAPEGFDQRQFWHDSFAVGALSKWIAAYVKDCDRETAFTCGMLHSIGILLMHMVIAEKIKSIDNAVAMGGKRHSLENSLLGFNYADVGAELAKRWKFPEEMQQAILQQDYAETDQPYSKLAGVIYIAKYLNDAHKKDWSDEQIIEQFPASAAEAIGLDTARAFNDLDKTSSLESGLDGLLE
ncbi:MAG: HDOD domain-containing protein [Saccharospirillaceae bacterium]|nr:HDOD domain-containing protein [Saccharospirillaceae bacterium]MCD8532006.1 HDOD domain-containing protein [Saccharospirillaceae bacterium]